MPGENITLLESAAWNSRLSCSLVSSTIDVYKRQAQYDDRHKFCRRVLAKLIEYGKDQNAAASIYRKPWAMEDPAVDKFAVIYQMKAHLPYPSDTGKYKE